MRVIFPSAERDVFSWPARNFLFVGPFGFSLPDMNIIHFLFQVSERGGITHAAHIEKGRSFFFSLSRGVRGGHYIAPADLDLSPRVKRKSSCVYRAKAESARTFPRKE